MDNYTGPFWSDGKLQTSVEFGSSLPTDYVDQQSRLHDSAYAHYDDAIHRRSADELYYDSLKDTPGAKAALARNLVLYGNYTYNQAAQLAEDISTFSFLGPIGSIVGLAYWEVNNLLNLNSALTGAEKNKVGSEILSYFQSDPHAELQHLFNSKGERIEKQDAPSSVYDATITNLNFGQPKVYWPQVAIDSPQVSIVSEPDMRAAQGYAAYAWLWTTRHKRKRRPKRVH